MGEKGTTQTHKPDSTQITGDAAEKAVNLAVGLAELYGAEGFPASWGYFVGGRDPS